MIIKFGLSHVHTYHKNPVIYKYRPLQSYSFYTMVFQALIHIRQQEKTILRIFKYILVAACTILSLITIMIL